MVLKNETLPIHSENDIVSVRQAVRRFALEAKFGVVDQTKVITAASELARNTLIYGKGGNAILQLLENHGALGIQLTFEDQGPGIPDINQALQDGFTTGNGMGLGLSGAKRLMNEFDIQSEVGKGTKIKVTHWLRKRN